MEGGATATGMTAFLEQATALFSWVMTNLGTIVTTVTGNPLMMVGFLMTLVGLTFMSPAPERSGDENLVNA